MDWLPLDVENIIWMFVREFHRADAIERWQFGMNRRRWSEIRAWRDLCYDIRTNVPRYSVIRGDERLRLSVFAPDCNPYALNLHQRLGQNIQVIRRVRTLQPAWFVL